MNAIVDSGSSFVQASVGPYAVLHTGDRVRFWVKLDAPGFIYLLGRSDNDIPEVIYSSPWPTPGNPGGFMSPLSSSIKLEDQAAIEDFVVFASRQAVPTEKLIELTQKMPPPTVAPPAQRLERSFRQKKLHRRHESRAARRQPRAASSAFAEVDMGERNFTVFTGSSMDVGKEDESMMLMDGLICRRVAFRHDPTLPNIRSGATASK